MKSKIPLLYFLIFSTLCSAQQIVKLKGDKLPIVCYAEDIEEIQTHIGEPLAFQNRKSDNGRIKTSSFQVDYFGFSSEAQAAFDYAVSIWASILSSPRPIRVAAVWTNLPTGVLGSAGPSFWVSNFKGTPKYNVYYPGALAEKLANEELNDPNDYEIVAQFNSTANWYFQSTGTPAVGQHDFITVVLHELGHGLGFTSTFEMQNALGAYGEFTDGIPFPFDLALENGSTQNLFASFNSPSTQLGSQLVSNNLFTRTPINNVLAKLYAPNVFNDGSSIAHLDPSTFPQGSPNSLMRPFINTREVNHDPGPIVRNVFAEMGWITTYIRHDHLIDRESVSLPIEFKATIHTDETDGYSFDNSNVVLTYSSDGAPPVETIMTQTLQPEEYAVTLPAPNTTKTYSYSIKVEDSFGRDITSPGLIYYPANQTPAKGPENTFYSFSVGLDNSPPVTSHTPRSFISYLDDALVVDVEITESSGLSDVDIEYFINNETHQTSAMNLIGLNQDLFNGRTTYKLRETIPFLAGQLQDGDEFNYRIIARDNAAAKNVASDPSTDYHIIPVIGLAPTQSYYVNNFNSPSDDFIGNDFSISTPAGFTNAAIHSVHPYPEAGAGSMLDLTYQLRIPIVISTISDMSFDEIVLVEPGEEGALFGSSEFYDYVVVEGSRDGGNTWTPLRDGYDSRDHTAWQTRYENQTNSNGDASLFRRRTINLLNTYAVGDEVVFRFRLFSDPFGAGWGWTIDNLQIQVDDVAPVILHNHINYVLKNAVPVSVPVKVSDDLQLGKLIFDHTINDQAQPSQEFDLDGTGAIVDFNLDFGMMEPGESISYKYELTDSAGNVSMMPANGEYFLVPVVEFEDVVEEYTNDFDGSLDDFVGNFLEEIKPDGFSSNAIHTSHPYSTGFGFDKETDITYTLKKKIILREENPYIQFDEIAVIEDHPASAFFGTPAFKDYVIVEASKDNGFSWMGLVEGYDAKKEDVWLSVFQSGDEITSTMYRRRTINFLDTDDLSDGDNVLVRFRLFSDESISGWGWAIDNLHIQDIVTAEEGDILNQINVFPNPVIGNEFIVDFGNFIPKSVSISNALGQLLSETEIGKNKPENEIKIPTGNFPAGMYFVRLNSADRSIVKKIIIRR